MGRGGIIEAKTRLLDRCPGSEVSLSRWRLGRTEQLQALNQYHCPRSIVTFHDNFSEFGEVGENLRLGREVVFMKRGDPWIAENAVLRGKAKRIEVERGWLDS